MRTNSACSKNSMTPNISFLKQINKKKIINKSTFNSINNFAKFKSSKAFEPKNL